MGYSYSNDVDTIKCKFISVECIDSIDISVGDVFNEVTPDFASYIYCKRELTKTSIGAVRHIQCDLPVIGRYIRISKSTSCLELCEVEVYSEPRKYATLMRKVWK